MLKRRFRTILLAAIALFVCLLRPGVGQAQEQAPVVPGCYKDTDCKGDRICEQGTCVSPVPTATVDDAVARIKIQNAPVLSDLPKAYKGQVPSANTTKFLPSSWDPSHGVGADLCNTFKRLTQPDKMTICDLHQLKKTTMVAAAHQQWIVTKVNGRYQFTSMLTAAWRVRTGFTKETISGGWAHYFQDKTLWVDCVGEKAWELTIENDEVVIRDTDFSTIKDRFDGTVVHSFTSKCVRVGGETSR